MVAGGRGTHDDSDGATGADRNMPADKPAKQRDFGGAGGRGTHDDGGSPGPTPKPSTLKPGTDDGGTSAFSPNASSTIEFGDHDPRRSHS